MTQISRRNLLAIGGAGLGLAACGNGVGSNGGATIDARVDSARQFLISTYPGTQDLMNRASGILWMPLVTEGAFGVGGSYGRGALRINNATVDYYSAASASIGFQIGGQQYGHALFFMTPDALADFRSAAGWQLGADAQYALPDRGGSLGTDTTSTLAPVVVLVFGQAGLIAGASLAGTKYTRILP